MRKKKNSAGDVACAKPRLSRQHRKANDSMQIPEKKITDLITSSTRKQTVVHLASEVRLRKIGCMELSGDLTDRYLLVSELDEDVRLATNLDYEASGVYKGCPQKASQCAPETIFSPGFQFSECVGSAKAYKVDCPKYSCDKDQTSNIQNNDHGWSKSVGLDGLIAEDPSDGQDLQAATEAIEDIPDKRSLENGNGSVCTSEMEELEANQLTTKGLPLCLEIQYTKMKCDDLHPDAASLQVYPEADEDDEMVDFDPYLFIRNLPDLSTVVPTFRPLLLPKQTRSCPSTTLVLDLDETLVHSTLEHCDDADFTFPVNFNLKDHTVYVRCRPHLMDFMEKVASMFEIIVFTASQSIYAEQLLNMLDPKRKIFRHRVYREACVFVDGNYLKDLTVLGRDLARIAIIDNSPQAFGFQVDNGIPIESWFDDRSDDALISLVPFLETLVGVDDVRPLIAEKFSLREKVAAAVDPYNVRTKGDPFDM